MQTRLSGLLIAGIAMASIALTASPVRSYAQSGQNNIITPTPAAGPQRPVHPRRGVRAPAQNRATVPLPQPSARRAASQQAPKKPELTRPEFTAADQAAAQIPGMPDARFWADSAAEFERALPPQPGPWLILSTGGEEGAYGAGFLNGWSASGARPQFAVITGVSTGALMATYAFAGSKFDEELHQNYTTITAGDIFEVGATAESLTDSWPLGKLIDKRVTPELLATIAAEHAKGRRLFVVTTNLDAGKAVVWNMGAIAAHGGPEALKLFRQILLASASVEGMFPPVYITAEANGRQFQEMHADGGATGPLFFGPVQYLTPGAGKRLPATGLYVILNGKLSTEFYMPSRNTAAILGRAISVALQAGGRLELALATLAAKQSGVSLNLTYVDDSFTQVGRGLFDPKYMNALYDYGVARGSSNDRFRNGSPMHIPPAGGGASSEATSK